MESHNGAEQVLAELGDPPAAGVRYFRDQAADMESFQESADPCGVPLQYGPLFVMKADKSSNVAAVESTQQIGDYRLDPQDPIHPFSLNPVSFRAAAPWVAAPSR